MSVFYALKLGFKSTWKQKRLIFYLWSIHLFFSFLFILPIFFLFRELFSHSLLASDLTRGINVIVLGDLVYSYRNLASPFFGGIILAIVLWIPISLSMTGGIFGALRQAYSFRWADFLAAAGRYFFPFFRLFLLFLLSLIIFFLPLTRLLSSLFRLWTEKAATAWPAIWSGLIKMLILLIIYSWLRMFFDYSRAFLVLEDTRQVIKVLGRCASFLSVRFLAAWAVFLAASLVSVILTILYFFIYRLTATSSLLSYWFIFLWGQVYLFLSLAGKVLLLGSCYHFSHLNRGGASPGNQGQV